MQHETLKHNIEKGQLKFYLINTWRLDVFRNGNVDAILQLIFALELLCGAMDKMIVPEEWMSYPRHAKRRNYCHNQCVLTRNTCPLPASLTSADSTFAIVR